MANDQVLDLARRQFGVISRRQLVELVGLDGADVDACVRSGELLPQLPSVHRLASAPDTFLTRAFAVQLWAGGEGYLSSWTAARIQGLRRMPGDPIHFTPPPGFDRSAPSWVRLERSLCDALDRTPEQLSSGLVVSSPSHMMFELARDLAPHRFVRAADDAWQLGMITPTELTASLDRRRTLGARSYTLMKQWLDAAASRSRPTHGNIERELIVALRRAGLPPVSRAHPVRLASGAVIDLGIAWPGVRLAIEPTDPWSTDGNLGDVRHDERDVACREVGWEVIRLDEASRLDPEGTARQIRDAYRARWRQRDGYRPLAPSDDAA